jgi:hypothetical protein
MLKATLTLLVVAFVLTSMPALAEDSSPKAPAPPLLSAQGSSCPRLSAETTPAPHLPPELLMPQPEAKVILCGWCSESTCVYKNVRANCRTSDGSFGTCTTLSPVVACSGEVHTECYCGQFP